MTARKHWDIVISPRRRLLDLDLGALWRYRDLIRMFVKRDFVAFYKQTVLGPLWYVLQPLFTTAVFTVVFNRIASIPTDGTPPFLFYLTGLVPWAYFAACMTKTSDTFIANAQIFGKVYFPRLTVPLAVVITNMLTFFIHLGVVASFLAFFAWRGAALEPTVWLLAIPLLLVQMGILGLGVGTLLSSLTTRYRDLTFVVTFGTQLWMFATPVVYPLSQVPDRWQWVLALNPMTSIVEIFRIALLGAGTVRPDYVVTSVIVTICVALLGLILFTRVERTSADTV
jgi:lipopolysaccharide transport system permease protein